MAHDFLSCLNENLVIITNNLKSRMRVLWLYILSFNYIIFYIEIIAKRHGGLGVGHKRILSIHTTRKFRETRWLKQQ